VLLHLSGVCVEASVESISGMESPATGGTDMVRAGLSCTSGANVSEIIIQQVTCTAEQVAADLRMHGLEKEDEAYLRPHHVAVELRVQVLENRVRHKIFLIFPTVEVSPKLLH
jgi:hypothetical protein